MAKFYDSLNDKHVSFMRAQKMFFVSTAPMSDEGRVNVSPKGYDSFIVLGPTRVAYADLGGSGIETVAHVRENGRITFMFCAFEGAPNIMRLYGRGQVMQFDDPGFEEELAKFPPGLERARNIIFADIDKVQDSCGFAVPFFDYRGERDTLKKYVEHDGKYPTAADWHTERLTKNAVSIDGLPGLVRKRAD